MKQRIEHLAAALTLLGVSIFISYYHTPSRDPVLPNASELNTLGPVKGPTANVTPHFDPSLIVSTSTFSNALPAFHPTTTKKSVLPRTVLPAKTPPAVTVGTTTQQKPQTEDPASLLDDVQKSLVNVLCTSHKPPLRGSTGSGVIIDSRGIILTVAHVAQSELLSEALGSDVISCSIRTGDPAKTAYHAKVIYISEPWLRKNSTTLISSQPTGTGENDFALLAITSSANGNPLPESFPALSLFHGEASVGQDVGIGGYAAQYLTNTQIRTALSPTLVMGSIDGIYTFGRTTQDVLSILGGKAAQEGSSGGAVVDTHGKLVGLITTSEISGPAETRHLRVITPGHMERSYSADTGKDLSSLLSSASLSALVAAYATTAQQLGTFLAGAIGLQ